MSKVEYTLVPLSLAYKLCHWDGGRSQDDTRHSMPPARRRGGFNLDV